MVKSTIRLSLIALAASAILAGCASLPKDFERPVSHALTDTQGTPLGKASQALTAQHIGESGLLLLSNGIDAFAARILLAESAQKSIDAQYYLLHDDMTGQIFTNALVRASRRGVRIRLLVDDLDLFGRDAEAATLSALPNFEVRLFHPFGRNIGKMAQFITRFGDVTRRMHNKCFIADNQFAILGGRNIGDQYFNAGSDVAFYDLDVLCVGDVVKEVSVSFDEYWNSDLAYPAEVLLKDMPTPQGATERADRLEAVVNSEERHQAYLAKVRNAKILRVDTPADLPFEWGQATAVYDRPEKLSNERERRDLHLISRLGPNFEALSKELFLVSPYFVPGRSGVRYLKSLTQQGVKVRILTNSLESNDVPIVHAGYSRYRLALLKAGVELYELKPSLKEREKRSSQKLFGSSSASLHSKTFVLDRETVFIGSMNLDPRSSIENTEIGVVFHSSAMAGTIVDGVELQLAEHAYKVTLVTDKSGHERLRWSTLENGKEIIYSSEPNASFWKRFGTGFLSLLPIESQL
ncbi:phospholipase D family protein [Pseudodesulfovibrio thermohalotolerans]|uniref:phospholipase D family protein n=1 Tax=Pseudodesulfovibrio thermohalotolerans TaxID=2880651 RepID=UPI002442C5E2|nr:phospholipase D family protein [Pseudodesulfovibrio thermohalotolerans]WFS62963.1 phospholipase D family protein [Pseudodesulfovibrio thermohalotolerans]